MNAGEIISRAAGILGDRGINVSTRNMYWAALNWSHREMCRRSKSVKDIAAIAFNPLAVAAPTIDYVLPPDFSSAVEVVIYQGAVGDSNSMRVPSDALSIDMLMQLSTRWSVTPAVAGVGEPRQRLAQDEMYLGRFKYAIWNRRGTTLFSSNDTFIGWARILYVIVPSEDFLASPSDEPLVQQEFHEGVVWGVVKHMAADLVVACVDQDRRNLLMRLRDEAQGVLDGFSLETGEDDRELTTVPITAPFEYYDSPDEYTI